MNFEIKKTGHLYSSKFSIHVLDLTRIDLATAEDQNYEIDRWAKLFKAKTWEELRMIAKNNPDLLQASNDLYTYMLEAKYNIRNMASGNLLKKLGFQIDGELRNRRIGIEDV